MSGVINILELTGSFFMLEVYDRVLPSRSIPTLIGLIDHRGMLYAFQGVLDLIRGRILVRIGGVTRRALCGRVYDLVARLPLKGRNRATACSRCAISTRSDRSCPGTGRRHCSICPGCRFYLAICFLFHL